MGNCNRVPTDGAHHPPPTDLNVRHTSNSKPPPSPLNRPRPPSGQGRVLGRPMEDVRETYIFGRELGRGQFGVTYLVTHKETKEKFACKSIATRKLINRDDIEDVRREVQIMHHLTGHRNIVELKGAYGIVTLSISSWSFVLVVSFLIGSLPKDIIRSVLPLRCVGRCWLLCTIVILWVLCIVILSRKISCS